MAVIKPKLEYNFATFHEFCNIFNVNSKKIAGIDGCDDELIIEEINTLNNGNWILNFIDDTRDGYFRLQLIE